MLYKDSLKEEIVSTLEDKVETISDSIAALIDLGYSVNNNKYIILDWSSILIHAYENIDILSKEQQDKLDIIFDKIMQL